MKRVRTADYDQVARDRLAEAVRVQRVADGHKRRPSFVKAADISLRSLADLEQGKPGVGDDNLRAVGRALSTWTEETPRIILEGGPIPPTSDPLSGPPSEPAADRSPGFAPALREARREEIAHMSYEETLEMAERVRVVSGVDAAHRWLEGATSLQRQARESRERILERAERPNGGSDDAGLPDRNNHIGLDE